MANTPRQYKNRDLKKFYGITLACYEQMEKAQKGACSICGGVSDNGKRLSVDHDHSTGAVRALLCQRCNLGLSFFREDTKLLTKAKAYLKRHSK